MTAANLTSDQSIGNPLSGVERLLTNVVFLLTFFSYFKVIPFIDAENQPVASIVAALLLLLFPKRSSLAPFFLLSTLIVIWACVSVFVRPDNLFGTVVRDLFTILAPLLVYLAMRDRMHFIRPAALAWTIWIWFVVVCIQYFSFLEVFRGPMMAVLGGLISRFAEESIGGGFRGVTGLASEPAIAAINIFCMFLSAWLFYIQKAISGRLYGAFLVAIGIMCVANKSGSLYLYLALLLATCAYYGVRYTRIMIVAGFGAILVAIGLGDFGYSRLGQILEMLANVDWERFDPMRLAATLGGLRWPTIYISYMTPLFHPVTFFGAQFNEFLATATAINLDIRTYIPDSGVDSHKPPSYGAFVSLNFGLIGAIVLFTWAVRNYSRVWRQIAGWAAAPQIRVILICAMFLIIGFSITASPLPWVILAQIDHVLQGRESLKQPGHN